MSITYPLTMPTEPEAPKDLSFQIIHNQMESKSPFSNVEQIADLMGDYWRFELEYAPMPYEDAIEWSLFFNKLRGRVGSFYFSPPNAVQFGVGGGTPVVDSLNSDRISVESSGWPTSTSGVLLPGDWISFTNGEIKQVISQVDSDGSGDATIEFLPPMRNGITASSSISIGTSAKGVFRMVAKDNKIDIGLLMFAGISFMIKEDLT